jgi:hypothetical protein
MRPSSTSTASAACSPTASPTSPCSSTSEVALSLPFSLSLSVFILFIYLLLWKLAEERVVGVLFSVRGLSDLLLFFLITRNSLTPDSDPAPVESLWLAAFSLLKKSYTYRSKGVVRGDRLVEFLKLSNWNRQDVRPAWFMSGTRGPMI